jgi:hypothetical protein
VANYFVRISGAAPTGPLRKTEICRMAASGELAPDDLVGATAEGPWSRASKVPQLAALLPPREMSAGVVPGRRVPAPKGRPSAEPPPEPPSEPPSARAGGAFAHQAPRGRRLKMLAAVLVLAVASAAAIPLSELISQELDGASANAYDRVYRQPTVKAEDVYVRAPAAPAMEADSLRGARAASGVDSPAASTSAVAPAAPEPAPVLREPPEKSRSSRGEAVIAEWIDLLENVVTAHQAFESAFGPEVPSEDPKAILAALERVNEAELRLWRFQVPDELMGCQIPYVARERLEQIGGQIENARSRLGRALRGPRWAALLGIDPNAYRDVRWSSSEWVALISADPASSLARPLRGATLLRERLGGYGRALRWQIGPVIHAIDAEVAYAGGNTLGWIQALQRAVHGIQGQDILTYYLFRSDFDVGRSGRLGSPSEWRAVEATYREWTDGVSIVNRISSRWRQEAEAELPQLDSYYRRYPVGGSTWQEGERADLQRLVFAQILGTSRSDVNWNARAAREHPQEYAEIKPYIKY